MLQKKSNHLQLLHTTMSLITVINYCPMKVMKELLKSNQLLGGYYPLNFNTGVGLSKVISVQFLEHVKMRFGAVWSRLNFNLEQFGADKILI